MRTLPRALDSAGTGRCSLVLLSARLLDPVTGEFLPDTALAVSGGRSPPWVTTAAFARWRTRRRR